MANRPIVALMSLCTLCGAAFAVTSADSGQPSREMQAGVDRLDRMEISMGLELSTRNRIALNDAPVCRTYSDKTIDSRLREKSVKSEI